MPELTPGHALRVAIVTNILPNYRQGFYDRLFSRKDIVATVYCRPSIPGLNVRAVHARYPGRVKLIKGISAKGEALAWQRTPWRALLFDYDVVFVDGNPRILSHALLATLLRVCRRPVVLWTMAHSYRARKVTERLRLRWTRMFDRLFVYTDAEVGYLRERGFTRQTIAAMNNGLDQARIDQVIGEWGESQLAAWRTATGLVNRTLLLSCARLDPKNRFDLIIAALPMIVRQLPDVMWCAIGSGPESDRLQSLVRERGLGEHVRFVGEVHDEQDLAPWFLSASAFVHPAAIGLSLLHAFGYGLPVITHGNADHHGPEFAAFDEGRSGLTFVEDDAAGLGAAVVALLRDRPALPAMRAHVQGVVRQEYNADVMVERFAATAKAAAAPRPDGH